jgi:hypothetical protein
VAETAQTTTTARDTAAYLSGGDGNDHSLAEAARTFLWTAAAAKIVGEP